MGEGYIYNYFFDTGGGMGMVVWETFVAWAMMTWMLLDWKYSIEVNLHGMLQEFARCHFQRVMVSVYWIRELSPFLLMELALEPGFGSVMPMCTSCSRMATTLYRRADDLLSSPWSPDINTSKFSSWK